MLVFGGFDGTYGGRRNDLWSYRAATNTWEQLVPNGAPPSPRVGHSTVWDAAQDRMLVFGGDDNNYLNDLWSYQATSNAWVQLDPSGGPPHWRIGQSAAWDAADSRMLVFGGSSLNDLWSYQAGALSAGTPTPGPSPTATPPPVNIPSQPTLVTSPDTFSSDSTPTWTFTGEPGATFNCTLIEPFQGMLEQDGRLPPPPVLVDSGPCNSGVYTFDLGAYPDHGYALSVTQTVADNTSPALVDKYTLDRIAYTPLFSAAPDAVSSDPTPAWTFYAYGEIFPVQITCTLGRNGSTTPVYSGPCGPEKFTFDLGPYPDDTYTLSAVLTDQAGNISGPATDTFVIDRSIPNAPPTATFTVSCSALTCNFDGRASADIDGTIVSYTWDYGDGTVDGGSGPCPCWKYRGHAFNASGSYTVKLTVVDNAEASGSMSRLVTVPSTGALTDPLTPADTPTATPTVLVNPTDTPTPTQMPQATATSTSSPSDTPAATPTESSTATQTPTPTPTPAEAVTMTSTPTPTPTVTANNTLTPTLTPTATPTATDTATPTATATEIPTPTIMPAMTGSATPPGQRTVTFDDLTNPNRVLNGAYPTGLIRWGSSRWFLSGPVGTFATNSVHFQEPGSSQESIAFVAPRRVVQITAYNHGTADSTVTLACAGQRIAQVTLVPNQQTTLVTGWTAACSRLRLGSTNGGDTYFDNLVVDGA